MKLNDYFLTLKGGVNLFSFLLKSTSILCFPTIMLSNVICAQKILDPCFNSIDYNDGYGSSSEEINVSGFFGEWINGSWNFHTSINNRIVSAPPCDANFKGLMMGASSVGVVAFKLDSPLKAGDSYTFEFTYIADGFQPWIINPYHRPNVWSSSSSSLVSTLIDTLPSAFNQWVTNSITFVATLDQDGHDWIELRTIGLHDPGLGIILSEICDLGNDTSICSQNELWLEPASNNLSFVWDNGSNDSPRLVNQPGTYWIRYDNNDLCTDTIEVLEADIELFSLGPDTILCPDDYLYFNLDLGNATTYVWQGSDTIQQYRIIESGNYEIFVSNHCDTLMDQINVNYYEIPELPTLLCENEELELNATSSGAISYSWDNGSQDSIRIVSNPGDYSVEVEFPCGFYTSSTTVELANCQCQLYVPNSFTPNSDLINDEFKITNECNITGFNISIFNRWGQVVMLSNDPSFSWDGRLNGNLLPEGIYSWRISYSWRNPENQEKMEEKVVGYLSIWY